MAKDYVEILKIKKEEESEIKKNSPASLPLNPTAQGWSGQEIRKKLSQSIIGEKGSILALLNERLITLGEHFNDIDPVFIKEHIIVSETEPEEQEVGGFWLETE